MSYTHLANSLYDLRTEKLRSIATKKYRDLEGKTIDIPSLNNEEAQVSALNLVLDRAANQQGKITELYSESSIFGVPQLKFAEFDVVSAAASSVNISDLQKALKIKKTSSGPTMETTVQEVKTTEGSNLELDLTVVAERLNNACNGKTFNQGGYNTLELLQLIKKPPVGGELKAPKPASRANLLEVLCNQLLPILPKETKTAVNVPVKSTKKVTKPKRAAAPAPVELDVEVEEQTQQSPKKDFNEVVSRLKKACKGKSFSEGGYNLPDLVDLIKNPPLGNPLAAPEKMTRVKILEVLCRDLIPQIENNI